jgi:hypothetical protein
VRPPVRMLATGLAALAAGGILGFSLLRSSGAVDGGAAISRPVADGTEADPDGAGREQLDQFTVAVQGFNYGEPGFAATRDKTQNKLWFHDNSWWATMINPFTAEVHIFELQDSSWVDTGVFVDSRPQSNADVVWTGQSLYVASRTSTGALLLQRYGYDAGRTWVPQTPEAELIADGGGQSLTIAVDSQDRVWASWIAEGRVWISSSAPGGSDWATPVTPPGGENVQEDDATAVTALHGGIGLLFSNQERDAFHWISRVDTAPVNEWVEDQEVTQGTNFADGHIDFALSPTGDLYAAVKTSLGDDGEPQESALIEVLHRDPAGTWTKTTAATVSNQMTRAQLLVTKDGAHLILVATSPQSGGSLYYKVTETADPRFSPGKGSLLLGWENAVINDATTTRAPVDRAIPLIILASDSANAQYYHAELSLDAVLSDSP